MRNIHTMWQRIIHKGRCKQLAVFVIDKLFEERPAKTLRNATIDLTLDFTRVNRKTYILHSQIIKDTYFSCLRINGYPCYMHTVLRWTCFKSQTATSIDW